MYTRIPPFKNGHRELLKKNVHLFIRPRELKPVQKKGGFTVSAHFGPVLRGHNGTPKTLKINVSQLRKRHPLLDSQEHGTLRVFFDHSDPRDPKNDLGSPWQGRIERGWLISQKNHENPRKRAKMSHFGRFCHFRGPTLY